jgi:hypothetical protein
MLLIVIPKDAFSQKGLWFGNQNRMYKTAVLKDESYMRFLRLSMRIGDDQLEEDHLISWSIKVYTWVFHFCTSNQIHGGGLRRLQKGIVVWKPKQNVQKMRATREYFLEVQLKLEFYYRG